VHLPACCTIARASTSIFRSARSPPSLLYTHVHVTINRSKDTSTCVLHNCTCVHQQLLISTQPPFPPLHTRSRNNQPQQTCIYLRAAQLHVRPPAAVDQHAAPLCLPYTHVHVTINRSKDTSTCVLHNCTCVHQQLLISTQPPFPPLHTPSRNNQLQQTCIYLRAAQLHVRPTAAVDQHAAPLPSSTHTFT